MKRTLAFFVAFVSVMLLFSSFSVFAVEAPSVTAKSAVVLCLTNGETVYEKNANLEVYPVSTVKMMTGLIASEKLATRLDEAVTVTKGLLGTGSGYRCLYIKEGDTLTVRDLLYGAVCGCDYDACYAVAVLSCGSVSAFLSEMNHRADSVGAVSTHFTNPTGVHDGAMVTTASDVAKIAKEAYQNKLYVTVSSAEQYVCSNGKRIYNRNALVSSLPTDTYRDTRCEGLNTGSTDEGGYCIATVAHDGDYTYLAVLMGVAEENRQYREATSLFDWAFSGFGQVELIRKDTVYATLPVTLSESVASVDLAAAESFSGYFPVEVKSNNGFRIQSNVNETSLEAPVAAGTQVGRVCAFLDGELLCEVPLLVTVDVEKSEFLSALGVLRGISEKRSVRAAAAFAVLFFLIYFVVLAVLRRKNKRRRDAILRRRAKQIKYRK